MLRQATCRQAEWHGSAVMLIACPFVQVHRLHSAQQAAAEYEKRKKKFKPTSETVFNQRAVFEAYDRRSESIPYTQVCVYKAFSIWCLVHVLFQSSSCQLVCHSSGQSVRHAQHAGGQSESLFKPHHTSDYNWEIVIMSCK